MQYKTDKHKTHNHKHKWISLNDLSCEEIGLARTNYLKKNVPSAVISYQRCIGNLSLASRAVCKWVRRPGHGCSVQLEGDVSRTVLFAWHTNYSSVAYSVCRRQRFWNSWKYLCSAGCGHGFVDMRKLKQRSRRQHACRRSLYEVTLTYAWPSVCVVPRDNIYL